MKIRNLLILGLLACPLAASAQEPAGPWTLSQCIAWAQEHNITVQQSSISAEQSEIELNTARNSRLPGVSSSASQSYSFGRGLSMDNTYVNTNTSSTSINLGASMDIFNGFRTNETIKLDQLNLKAATADLEKARNDLSLNVAQAYVQILYDMEIRDVASRQVAIDSFQVARLEDMVRTGKASGADLAQQQATLAQSQYSLTQAENNLSLALLTLSQLLELPSPEGFSIVAPEVDPEVLRIEDPESVYSSALVTRPEILAEQYRLSGYDSQIKIAKSSLYPSLSFNGGLGTNYYTTSGYDHASFGDQITNNFSQYLGLSLNIPIFSKFSIRNDIRTAELRRRSQELQLENTKKNLYKEIQQAYYNAVAALAKYRSSQEAAESAEKSFELVTSKYENGKASITEFNEARNNALKSASDLVQSRYEFLYQTKVLSFYKGEKLG